MLYLLVTDSSFVVGGNEPFRVENMQKGPAVAHVYDGATIDHEQNPAIVFDGHLGSNYSIVSLTASERDAILKGGWGQDVFVPAAVEHLKVSLVAKDAKNPFDGPFWYDPDTGRYNVTMPTADFIKRVTDE